MAARFRNVSWPDLLPNPQPKGGRKRERESGLKIRFLLSGDFLPKRVVEGVRGRETLPPSTLLVSFDCDSLSAEMEGKGEEEGGREEEGLEKINDAVFLAWRREG
jgi:hypothetical protein